MLIEDKRYKVKPEDKQIRIDEEIATAKSNAKTPEEWKQLRIVDMTEHANKIGIRPEVLEEALKSNKTIVGFPKREALKFIQPEEAMHYLRHYCGVVNCKGKICRIIIYNNNTQVLAYNNAMRPLDELVSMYNAVETNQSFKLVKKNARHSLVHLFDTISNVDVDFSMPLHKFMQPKKNDGKNPNVEALRNGLFNMYASGEKAVYDHLCAMIAYKHRNPYKPLGQALIIMGEQGTGKSSFHCSFLSRVFRRENYATANCRLPARFNPVLANLAVLGVNEMHINAKMAGRYKDVITNEYLSIKRKGESIYTTPNCLFLVGTTNDDKVVATTSGDRRFVIIKISNKYGKVHNSSHHLAEKQAFLNACKDDEAIAMFLGEILEQSPEVEKAPLAYKYK